MSPQCPVNEWWYPSLLSAMLDEFEQTCRVDPDRLYVTGLSMGGFGTWGLAIAEPHRSEGSNLWLRDPSLRSG